MGTEIAKALYATIVETAAEAGASAYRQWGDGGRTMAIGVTLNGKQWELSSEEFERAIEERKYPETLESLRAFLRYARDPTPGGVCGKPRSRFRTRAA